MSGVQAVLISVIPSIGVGLLFWFVMRAVIRADRNERAAIAAQEAAIDAQAAESAAVEVSSSDDGEAAASEDGSDGDASGRSEP